MVLGYSFLDFPQISDFEDITNVLVSEGWE